MRGKALLALCCFSAASAFQPPSSNLRLQSLSSHRRLRKHLPLEKSTATFPTTDVDLKSDRAEAPSRLLAGSSSSASDVTILPGDYKLSAGIFFLVLVLAQLHLWIPSLLFGVIAAFLARQTSRVRFVFDKDALEVMIFKDPVSGKREEDGEQMTLADLTDSGENFAVGGQNRWNYDTFYNWEMYPSPENPILVYFKETQTKPEGQIHFFPVLFDGQKLRDVMEQKIPKASLPFTLKGK